MASRSLKNRVGTKTHQRHTIALSIVAVLITALVAAAIGVWFLCASWLQDLPDYTEVNEYNTPSKTTVLAADGTTVLAEFQLENRDPVPLDSVNNYVLQATIDTEDVRFYEHNGADLWGIARAMVVNLSGGQEGASTITQQLVRQTILSSEATEISIKRKIREIYLALKVEEVYTKDEILEMYLNTINYGAGAYGIQAAAQRYFSKDASDLTLVEAATLAGIPQSPTNNNPIDNPENCLARRNLVLDRMLSAGDITQEEHDAAQAEPINLTVSDISIDGIYAYPYFTSYVRDTLLNDYAYSTDELFKGGLTVYTTLDTSMQEAAESAAAAKLETVIDAASVAIVAVDPDNGYVRAMVGGKDWETSKVNLATGAGGQGRPAGSTFKTFTLIAAIEEGINPHTTYVDCHSTAELPGWTVSNFGGQDFGVRTIESAFAVSSNTCFARLAMSLGPERIVDVAHRLGIQSDLVAEGGLTLGADSSPVTPLEMANAYATIANGGTYYEATPILRVEDADGNVLIDNTNPTGTRVISEEVARDAISVMEGVVNGGTGTAARLSNGQPVAGKTGTQQDSKDIWFCGITPQLSVACWVGDPTNREVVGNVSMADAFRNFMTAALAGQPVEQFFEADSPEYKDYVDSEYLIGIAAEVEEEEEEEAEEGEEEGTEQSGSDSGQGAGGNAGATTPDTGGGGSSSGGSATGGGSSTGGESSGGGSSSEGGGTAPAT